MTSITLKNIPRHLHATYKRQARAHSRSLQAEILHTLAHSASKAPVENALKVEEVAGMLKPRVKGVKVEQMQEGVDQMFRKTWK